MQILFFTIRLFSLLFLPKKKSYISLPRILRVRTDVPRVLARERPENKGIPKRGPYLDFPEKSEQVNSAKIISGRYPSIPKNRCGKGGGGSEK